MLNLLRIEWMKVRNYRTFWILLGIIVVSIPAFNYMWYNILDNSFPKGKGGRSMLGSPFSFPDGWHTISWFSSLLFILPAILIITLTTNEFSFKTHRQNVIDGWSRGQFIGVKLIGILLLSVLGTLVVMLTVLGFGFLGSKGAVHGNIWQGSRYLFFYFVEMLSYSMISYVLSILIKRSGLAIAIFLIYMLVEQIMVAILTTVYHLSAGQYLPEETTDRLIPFPFAELGDSAGWEHRIPGYLIGAAIYLVIYCVVTSRYFLRSDL
ncbi:MAG TPA: ABC transporter permease [Puia sp.]|nr:ABC transporter permease [Puia sp.]